MGLSESTGCCSKVDEADIGVHVFEYIGTAGCDGLLYSTGGFDGGL